MSISSYDVFGYVTIFKRKVRTNKTGLASDLLGAATFTVVANTSQSSNRSVVAMLLTVVLCELDFSGPAMLGVCQSAALVIGGELDLTVLEVGTRPFLMQKLVDLLHFFLALDVLNEGEHADLLIGPREDLGDQGVHVETSKGDELPAIAHLGQIWHKVLDIILGHLLSVPVEARGEIVREEYVGLDGVDPISKFFCNSQIWRGSFHPKQVCVVCEGDTTLDAVGNRAVNAIVALIGTGGFPIEVEFEAVLASHVLGISKGQVKAVIVPKLNHLFALFSTEVLEDGNAASLREGKKFASILGINAAKNERMVNRINVAIQEGSAHCISSSADHEVTAHNISLETGGLETRNVLSNRNEHLPTEMTTLLDTRFLILEMNATGSSVDEHLD